jgi:hypothetical protein
LRGTSPVIVAAIAQAGGDEALEAELHASPHKILFEAYVDDNWDLFVMNADGSGRKNLTNTPDVHELYPQATPDGTKICFLADVQQGRDTLRSVYYMSADGTGRKLVADKARQPCWSPDGTKIAYLPQEFSRFNVADYVSKGLFIYDLKTGTSTPHPNPKIHHLYTLNWSKNGRWFVSTVHGGMGFGHAIIAIEVGGGGVYDLKIPGRSYDTRRRRRSGKQHAAGFQPDHDRLPKGLAPLSPRLLAGRQVHHLQRRAGRPLSRQRSGHAHAGCRDGRSAGEVEHLPDALQRRGHAVATDHP